ncbi:MAG TPA: S41 family peptidase [Bacteroidia bacterium]|nr:S41 family peptidase [Bacteroidia bacterium]
MSIFQKFRKAARVVVIPLSLATGGFIGFAAAPTDDNDDHMFEISKNLEIFGTLFQQLNKLYVDEPKPGELMKIGIDAMLASLDPYTAYISEEEIEDYRYETQGHYGGIGSLVRQVNNNMVIAEPYEGYAAQKAGLRAGDVILEVNGTNVEGKGYEVVGKLLKGLPGSIAEIKVQRPGTKEPMMFSVVREEIEQKNVPYYTMLEGNVGYIKLEGFMDDAGKEVREALVDLKSQGATSICLDLRDNPGGLLREAVNIVNLFVDKNQLVVTMRGRVAEWDKQYRTDQAPVDLNIPLVVMTSPWSASASEIVAGALQDLDRAVVVGQRSYGKGLVQQTMGLIYGSLFKVTVAKYYTPSGRCVQSLDYSERNADGTVNRFSDSLITQFKTKNGRIIWDGLGVIPDVEVPERTYSVLADTLIVKSLIFTYATTYTLAHPTIAKSNEFRLSDKEYEDFVTWVKTQDYKYVTKEETDLDKFQKHSAKSGSWAMVSAEHEALRKKIEQSKLDDFTEFKFEIKVLLEAEIASRYYYQKGRVGSSLKDDVDLKEALVILKDPKKWKSILTTVVQKEKPKQRMDMNHEE